MPVTLDTAGDVGGQDHAGGNFPQQGKDQSDSRWYEKQTGAAMTDLEIMQAYLMLKVRQADWHGVADAAMDIREMEARKAVEQKNEVAG